MISVLNDPTAQLLRSFPPPFKGTWTTLPVHLLPDDVLQDSLNVTIQNGVLHSRMGLSLTDSFLFNGSPIGSFMFIDSSNTKTPLVSTPTALYKYIGGYLDITGSAVLSASAQQVRMTSIQLGNFVYLLYANGVDTVKYAQNAGALQDITPYVDPVTGPSSIPVFTDICTAFSRIVGVNPPYTISWCSALNDSYLNFTNWPALNQAILADTEDSIVCIGSLGTLGLAIYKEGNIFVGFAQQGTDAQAFRFEHRGEYEGPAGVQAKVSVNGTHVYMTPTGRIGTFDGTQHAWICDGIWPTLRNTLDMDYTSKIFGVYSYKTSEIYFFYPRVGDSGALKGMLIIDLPYPTAGITDISYFLGETALSVSNGLGVRLFNTQVLPFVYADDATYTLDPDIHTDGSSAFSCLIKTGLARSLEGGSGPLVPILELYSARGSGKGILTAQTLTSNNLESSGIASDPDYVDLNLTPVNEYIGFNDAGSFIGAQLSWDSTANFEYKGMDLYARETV